MNDDRAGMRVEAGNRSAEPSEHGAAGKSRDAKYKCDCQAEQKRRGNQVIFFAAGYLLRSFVIDARERSRLDRKRWSVFGQQARPGKREWRARCNQQSYQRGKRETMIHRRV